MISKEEAARREAVLRETEAAYDSFDKVLSSVLLEPDDGVTVGKVLERHSSEDLIGFGLITKIIPEVNQVVVGVLLDRGKEAKELYERLGAAREERIERAQRVAAATA